jgi:sigma-E factor negative regulatory protein RseB
MALLLTLAISVPLHAVEPAQADRISASPTTPAAWLNKMNRAFANLDYDGLFSFYSGSELASVRVVHMLDNGIQRGRLVHLNGAPREIVRNGEEVICILQPGDKLVAMSDSIPAGPFARAFIRDFSDVSQNYELSMRGEDRIATRPSVRMLVKPRDEHRFGYRLWLDKATGLLLRSELMDVDDGKPLEIFQFNHIEIGSGVQPSALQPEKPQGYVIDHLEVAPVSAGEAKQLATWHASWLPKGFSMASADLRHAVATKKDVNTLMYSDGLAVFSLFIESMPDKAAIDMIARSGATVSVSRLVSGPNNQEHLVTLVGEVPPKTARSIASSVTFKK